MIQADVKSGAREESEEERLRKSMEKKKIKFESRMPATEITVPMAKGRIFIWMLNFGSARIPQPVEPMCVCRTRARYFDVNGGDGLKSSRRTLRQYFVLANRRNNLSGSRTVGTEERGFYVWIEANILEKQQKTIKSHLMEAKIVIENQLFDSLREFASPFQLKDFQ